MTEKSHKKQHNQILAEMETNLARAYRVINQQQQQIQRLQNQLSQNQNHSYQQESTVIQNNSHSPTNNISSPRAKRKTLHNPGQKNLQKSKTAFLKLSNLQFAGLVAVVTILMTLMSLALMRRQNPNSLHPPVAPSETLTKRQK